MKSMSLALVLVLLLESLNFVFIRNSQLNMDAKLEKLEHEIQESRGHLDADVSAIRKDGEAQFQLLESGLAVLEQKIADSDTKVDRISSDIPHQSSIDRILSQNKVETSNAELAMKLTEIKAMLEEQESQFRNFTRELENEKIKQKIGIP
jgi:cell division protein FtsL